MLAFSGLAASPTIDLSTPTKSRTLSRLPATSNVRTVKAEVSILEITRANISLEYTSLIHAGHCPLGMYVTPSVADLLVWDAVFFVHQGYYADSILKFRLIFPPNYPERPPNVQFVTDVFHPLISQQDGTFNLLARFRLWRPKDHHVFDVLHYIKTAFKKHALDQITETDSLNREAYRYHDTTSSFAALATQSSMLSQSASALFDRDHPSMAGKGPHTMQFRELKSEQLDELRAKLGLHDWTADETS